MARQLARLTGTAPKTTTEPDTNRNLKSPITQKNDDTSIMGSLVKTQNRDLGAEEIRARRRARRNARSGPTRPPRLSKSSRIVSDGNELLHVMANVPTRYRGRDAQCVYSTADDGISLNTLYSRVAGTDPIVLLVRDDGNATFGVFSSVPFRPDASAGYSGSGESFVFQVRPEKKTFTWTRTNTFFQLCTTDSIAVGGGGEFAFFIDSMLERGSSGASTTFGNKCLASQSSFNIVVVEAFKLVVPSRLSFE